MNSRSFVESWSRRELLFVLAVSLSWLVSACARPYRVGDHVLVEWGDENLKYPAFIIEKKNKSKFRVHYDGYPARWDEDVALPRIVGWVEGEVPHPPPPKQVRLARGLDGMDLRDTPVSPFKVDDKIRVRWRESDYLAIVLEIVSSKELRVHYEGHESAWDEVVPVSRVVATP
jgi:hypothetical protein